MEMTTLTLGRFSNWKKTFKWDKDKHVSYFQESVFGEFINIRVSKFLDNLEEVAY